MRRTLAALIVVFGLAGCAGTTGAGGDPGTTPDSDVETAFAERAEIVAQAWREHAATGAWRDGFVPLQELTVPPPGGFPDGDAKSAFEAGYYVAEVPLPETAPEPGTVRFPDGATLSLPLVSAREAYAALDQGDPPCRNGTPVAPTPSAGGPSGPDQATSAVPPHVCAVLTVTGVTLGETRLRTSRGEASVPAWLFTVAGLTEPVARVAVAPSAVHPVPTPSLPDSPHVPGLVTAQHLTSVDGATLVYQLGVGTCDYDIRPLVHETPEVVVIGGSVRTKPGMCNAMLKLEQVRVTLAQPLDGRPVVDVGTGTPLTVR
jgi:hypothetical protein